MQNKKFSSKKYLKEKGRKLPIDMCLVSDLYEDDGLTMCLIVRKQPSGLYSFAHLLVDRLCLGVKNTMVNCNFPQEKLSELIYKLDQYGPCKEVTPAYFHNLIYGAIDYAAELGLDPPKDFYIAEYVLDPNYIDDGIDEIEMGRNGKPFYVEGPYDNKNKIISALNKSVGSDGFVYIMSA